MHRHAGLSTFKTKAVDAKLGTVNTLAVELERS
jgi:hypothetical protein